MIRRLGLRARVTIFVTVVFAAALTVTSVFVVGAVEDRLVADTRASAEAVLSEYLESIYGGVATVGVVDPDASTRFFYLDEDGAEISERQYFDAIESSFDEQMPEWFFDDLVDAPASDMVVGGGVVVAGPVPDVVVDGDSGALLGPDGASITLVAGPIPTGEPHRIDRGDDVVAVTQTLTFADGATIDVGVSNPLRPVTDSLDTMVDLLWIAVPMLVAVVALTTWLAATRALRPVQAIASQADAITGSNLDQRVPVHAANDEIRHLAGTVNSMLERLQRAQERQRQLIADASHELRSPVAATRTQLEVATANPETADWATTAATVLAEQDHLASLIDDLVALSQLDETGVGATTDVDLDDLVAAEAARQPIPIGVAAPEPVRVNGDQRLITRAVRNLLDNASRHTNGRVRITLTGQGDHAVIHIDDDGPGVPEAQREHIFERFARVDEARDRDRGGAGLGLAIARQVARAHHGHLACTDSPLGGARFTLTLPFRTTTQPAGTPTSRP